jgi:tRNA U34 5-methylaminomethyl-2-thiouridine-forming methyltransferase MnmC
MYELIKTKDGSLTYRNTEVGATYRSLNGAESESRYVFFEGTQLKRWPTRWRVLELGFGTGLNFAVTCREALKAGVELEYVSLESTPMPRSLWLVEEPWKDLEFGSARRIGTVQLTLVDRRWQDFTPTEGCFDACFHDPFGPGPSPECWERDCFEWSYRGLTKQGVLATFGASSGARTAMKEAGFFVGSLKGAHIKREMTVASKSEQAIAEAWPWKRKR